MVDRVWRLWQLKHPNPELSDNFLNQVLPPFPLTVKQVLNVFELGYEYAGVIINIDENQDDGDEN